MGPSKYVCALYGNPSNVQKAMFHDLQHLLIPTELNFHSCDPENEKQYALNKLI